jgi:hypothetical protein
MPQFSDDLFLGTGATYMGTGNGAATSVFTGTISTTTLTVQSTQSGDPLVVGQYIVGSSVTANSYITASLGFNSSGLAQYTLSQSSTVSSNTTMYASGNALLGDPAPMSLGVGPLGRLYVYDTIPQTLQAANIAASQTQTAAGALTLTAGTSAKSVVRTDGSTVIQLDVPRAVSVTTGTATGSTLAGVATTGTGGQISFTSNTSVYTGQYVTVSGTAGGTGSITSYSNPTTYILSAVTATSATLLTTASGAVASVAGTITGLTFTLGAAPRVMTVSGYDYYGQAMTESITSSSSVSTAVSGKKAFYQIASITSAGATGTAVTSGTTDVLGLPVRVIDAGYLVSIGWAGAVARDTGGNQAFVAADMTNPATSTTGDVRGTYLPSTASNGSRRLVIGIAVPAIAVGPNATRTGALGVTQA